MKKIIIFILLIVSIYSETIILASFNTLHLGWEGKDTTEVSKTLSLFDIVALQEVMDKKGIIELSEKLNNISKEKWSYILSPYAVGNSQKYDEYYGFIYNTSKVKFVKSLGFYPDKNNDFIREPYGAMFKSKNIDFILVTVHLIYGDSQQQREKEAKKLIDVYNYFQNLDSKENDVIILGDFNLPAYNDAFKNLFSHKDKIFYAISPTNKTTLGKNGLANSYDNIFYSFKYTKEYTGNNGVYNYVENYISKYKNPYETLRKSFSDHLPVFIELENSKDDD